MISGKHFEIPGELLTLGSPSETGNCLGNLQEVPPAVVSDLPILAAVLGATFMLRHLIALDLGNLQVGIARKSYIENATISESGL